MLCAITRNDLPHCRNVAAMESLCLSIFLFVHANAAKRQLYNHSTIVLVCARQRKAMCAPQPLQLHSAFPFLHERVEGIKSSSTRHTTPCHPFDVHRLLQHRVQLVRQHSAARSMTQLQHHLQPLLVKPVERRHLSLRQRTHQGLVVLSVSLPQRVAPFSSPPRLKALH